MAIRIEPELQSLIPPLSTDEYTQLEKNIIRDGVRDPLVVWSHNGDDVLVDGHNRYKIATSHAGIKFDVKHMEFKDMDDAKRWVILNQFGRRNLSAYDRSVLALKLKSMIAEKAKEKQSEAGGAVRQKSDKPEIDTKKELAKIAGVSHDTIHKVETIEKKATPQTKELVREGKLSINQAYNSVMPKREDPVKQAVKQAVKEHEEFKQEKKESVVDFKSVQIDKANQEIINTALFESVLKLLNDIDKFGFAHKTDELSGLYKVIKDDERELIAKRCQTCRMILQTIEEHIWRPYPGGS